MAPSNILTHYQPEKIKIGIVFLGNIISADFEEGAATVMANKADGCDRALNGGIAEIGPTTGTIVVLDKTNVPVTGAEAQSFVITYAKKASGTAIVVTITGSTITNVRKTDVDGRAGWEISFEAYSSDGATSAIGYG